MAQPMPIAPASSIIAISGILLMPKLFLAAI